MGKVSGGNSLALLEEVKNLKETIAALSENFTKISGPGGCVGENYIYNVYLDGTQTKFTFPLDVRHRDVFMFGDANSTPFAAIVTCRNETKLTTGTGKITRENNQVTIELVNYSRITLISHIELDITKS